VPGGPVFADPCEVVPWGGEAKRTVFEPGDPGEDLMLEGEVMWTVAESGKLATST
jgi:hypothetical protein